MVQDLIILGSIVMRCTVIKHTLSVIGLDNESIPKIVFVIITSEHTIFTLNIRTS